MNKKYLKFFLLIIVFFIVSIWVITIIQGKMPYTDQWTRRFVESLAHSKLYIYARWITELGSYTFLIPFTIVMGILLWRIYCDWFPAFIFSGGTLMSHLLNVFVKNLVTRGRLSIFIEAHAIGYSFPSGHAMISIVCYGLLIYFLQKKLTNRKHIILMQIGFSLLIFLIGMSRYIINVHYLTDVLSGFGFGYVLLMCFIYIFERIQHLNVRTFRK